MQQQADTVKKIVSAQTQQIHREYPHLLNYKQPEDSSITPPKEDTLSLEELRKKCEHFSKIFNITNPNHRLSSDSQVKPTSNNVQKRPVFIPDRHRPTTQKPLRTVNGFYITQITTKKPANQAQELPHNVKFIKLEPVILQKTILSDGRVIYYWHRSLPSSIQQSSVQQPASTQYSQVKQPTVAQHYQQHNYGPAKASLNQVPKPSTQYSNPSGYYNTPSTTTPSSSGLGLSNYFPFYWSSGSNAEPTTESTTTSTTVSTTTSTQKSTDDKERDLLYANQLRFVVPVPYEDPENVTKQAWEFDQFAYYPQYLQPNSVNVQVPYVPSFQMIKALTIPNQYVSINPDGSYGNKASQLN